MIVPQSNAAGCVNIAKALEQLGKSSTPVVSNPLCLDPAVPAGLGGDLPKWIYGIASSLGFDTTDPAVTPFVRGLTPVGQPKLAADAWVIVAWGQILTTVKLMNQIGVNKVTSANFTSTIRAFKGPQALGAPSLQCGKYPAEPAACNDQAQFFQYQGAGKFKRDHRLPQAAEHLQARRLSTDLPRRRGRDTAAPPPPGWETHRHGLEADRPLRDPRPRGRVADRGYRRRRSSLTYRGSGIINLSTGAIAMLAGYSYWSLKTGTYGVDVPTAPALVITAVFLLGVGLLIEFAVYRPLRTAAPLAKLAASLGVLLVAQAAVSLAFGIGTKPQPPVLPGGTVTVFGSNVPIDRFILPGIVLLATLVLSLVYRLTRFGLATRAASENEIGGDADRALAQPPRAGEHAARHVLRRRPRRPRRLDHAARPTGAAARRSSPR